MCVHCAHARITRVGEARMVAVGQVGRNARARVHAQKRSTGALCAGTVSRTHLREAHEGVGHGVQPVGQEVGQRCGQQRRVLRKHVVHALRIRQSKVVAVSSDSISVGFQQQRHVLCKHVVHALRIRSSKVVAVSLDPQHMGLRQQAGGGAEQGGGGSGGKGAAHALRTRPSSTLAQMLCCVGCCVSAPKAIRAFKAGGKG